MDRLKQLLTRATRGLLAIMPVMVTFYLIFFVVRLLERAMGPILSSLIPAGKYWPGFGFFASLIILSVTGLVLETYIARTILLTVERLINKVPMVKIIYRAIQDISTFMSESKKRKELGKPVWVDLDGKGLRVLGFVTIDHNPLEKSNSNEAVVVYLPMSYQIGGYTILVSREKVYPAEMSFEDAMKFAITAGVASSDLLGQGAR